MPSGISGTIEMLSKSHRTPAFMVDAIIYVNDTLDTAVKVASETLNSADPSVAMAVYDRLNAERLRLLGEYEAENNVTKGA